MKPERIQLSRKRGWRKPPNTIVVARPSRWGNPFRADKHGDYTVEKAVADYRRWITRGSSSAGAWPGPPPPIEVIRRELRGRNLACWCRLGTPCHADVLLEIANG